MTSQQRFNAKAQETGIAASFGRAGFKEEVRRSPGRRDATGNSHCRFGATCVRPQAKLTFCCKPLSPALAIKRSTCEHSAWRVRRRLRIISPVAGATPANLKKSARLHVTTMEFVRIACCQISSSGVRSPRRSNTSSTSCPCWRKHRTTSMATSSSTRNFTRQHVLFAPPLTDLSRFCGPRSKQDIRKPVRASIAES